MLIDLTMLWTLSHFPMFNWGDHRYLCGAKKMFLITKDDVQVFVNDANKEIWKILSSRNYLGNQYWLGIRTRDDPCQRVRLYGSQDSKKRSQNIAKVECVPQSGNIQGICKTECKPKMN